MEKRDIELIDYLRILWGRRWLIIVGVVGLMVAAGGVSLLIPEVYETTLQLRIGRVWETPIEDPYEVASVMNSDSFLNRLREAVGLDKSVHDMRRAKVIVAETLLGRTRDKHHILVNLAARGRSPKEAVELAQKAAKLIVDDHKVTFDEMMVENVRYEKDLERQINEVRSGIDKLNALLETHQKQSQVDAPAVILLQAQVEQKEIHLHTIAREARDIRIQNTSKIHTEDTLVANPPVLPEKPVKPKVALNIALAGLLGVIFMPLLAFFLDYLNRVRLRDRTPAVEVE